MDNIRIPVFCLILSLFFLTTTFEVALAKEDTAHLSFQKAATSKTKTRTYVVKKGEWLFDILQTQVGITSRRYTIIKTLNPHIKDIDKIEPGDVVILPDIEPPGSAKREDNSPVTAYTIKKGDTITRIAIRQLQTKKMSEVVNTVNEIKQMNPGIKNYNKIYPGQNLELPRRSIVITKQEGKVPEAESPGKVKDESKEKPVILPETRLAIIRHVISRMNGSIITTGKYYIPIPQVGQVTIDCSAIPVVELDDGSTTLLDFSDRIPDTLKNMIQASWKNYNPVKVNNNDNTTTILQKIINTSNIYVMTKRTALYIIGNTPPLQLSVDWMITKKASGSIPYLQGLSFVADNSQLLPKPLTSYAEKNGLIITEIMDGYGVMSAADEKYTIPQVAVINSRTKMELINALINELGFSTMKDTEVGIFDTARDGFNLSIRADLLVKKEDRQILFLSKKIPQQFIDSLKNRGTETISFDEGETQKSVIEKVLQAMNVPYLFNSFSFSIPEKTNTPKGIINFPAFKITRDKGHFYLIDFDIDRDIYGLLHDKWEVNIVKY